MDDIDFIEIPERYLDVLGDPDPGTRAYRAFGPQEGFEAWWNVVSEICGPENAVSPGGVAMFAKVSRAAVYKRLSEGRLTAFLYHTVKATPRWWTNKPKLEYARTPYAFVPVSECKSWGALIRSNSVEREKVRRDRKTPVPDFIAFNPRRKDAK